jgi:hypothetical protein
MRSVSSTNDSFWVPIWKGDKQDRSSSSSSNRGYGVDKHTPAEVALWCGKYAGGIHTQSKQHITTALLGNTAAAAAAAAVSASLQPQNSFHLLLYCITPHTILPQSSPE